MLQLSSKFDESKLNPYWINMFTSSFGTNYVLNEDEDFDQYGTIIIPSKISYPSHLASLVNQNEIPIELSCQRAHLAVIMSQTSMKILTNMTQMQYPLR